jgi:HAD superfamily hydrolase (TIGR01484 family)
MDKKIVFFDIDGTIYDYKRGIPTDVPGAIKELRNQGVLTAICTGRTRVMIFDKIYNLGFDALVAGGGTYVEYEGEILSDRKMETKDVDEIVEVMRGHGFLPVPEGKKTYILIWK